MSTPSLPLGHGGILSILASLFFVGCLVLRFHATNPPVTIILPHQHINSNNNVAFISSSSNKDKKGWLLNPVTAAANSGLSGGARTCEFAHVGQIKPGGVRGNHRHKTCNETFVIWGAKTLFRFEDGDKSEKGYGEVRVGAEDVVVAISPQGRAHALANFDDILSTYFIGCQDAFLNSSNHDTDYRIWKDL